jgi:hypothetical protein
MITCAFCGAPLDETALKKKRHFTDAELEALHAGEKTVCCDRDHEVLRRSRDGFFKAMSVAGRDARSKAVTLSNQRHPRRKSKHGWSAEGQ